MADDEPAALPAPTEGEGAGEEQVLAAEPEGAAEAHTGAEEEPAAAEGDPAAAEPASSPGAHPEHQQQEQAESSAPHEGGHGGAAHGGEAAVSGEVAHTDAEPPGPPEHAQHHPEGEAAHHEPSVAVAGGEVPHHAEHGGAEHVPHPSDPGAPVAAGGGEGEVPHHAEGAHEAAAGAAGESLLRVKVVGHHVPACVWMSHRMRVYVSGNAQERSLGVQCGVALLHAVRSGLHTVVPCAEKCQLYVPHFTVNVILFLHDSRETPETAVSLLHQKRLGSGSEPTKEKIKLLK